MIEAGVILKVLLGGAFAYLFWVVRRYQVKVDRLETKVAVLNTQHQSTVEILKEIKDKLDWLVKHQMKD